MADLIFRGVKNPANCSECFFWPVCPCLADFDDYSAILDAVHDGNLVRHEKCPLVPLPAGHGRLIDGDALLNNNGVGTQIAGWGKMFHETAIAYAPTIVPADVADNYVGSKSEEGETDDSKL